MRALIDSFWRAIGDGLRPRVIGLSLLPLAVIAVSSLVLGWFAWTPAVAAMRSLLDASALLRGLTGWINGIGGVGGVGGVGGIDGFRASGGVDLNAALAPLIVVLLSLPAVVVLALLLVAGFMTPAMLRMVAARRFPMLERKRGGSLFGSIAGGLAATLVALLATVFSVPFWLIPPLVLILPPLIWGWLTYRVMTYDVLAEHASADERRELMRRQRMPLLAIGVSTGLLGTAPSLLWAAGALSIAWAPVLIPLSIWLYTLVFALSALWFAHFALAALAALRHERQPKVATSDSPATVS